MYSLTVFTPTYNRAYCLGVLYESLKAQTSKDFLWLIVDDGSVDNTEELINQWKNEGNVEIKFIKQRNMGMVAAHNTAHLNIETELNVCIDSDDYMPEDAVEIINNTWKVHRRDDLMGMVGLDIYRNGKIIGKKFPDDFMELTFSEILYKFKLRGDKKYVLRTDLIKRLLPYPYFENEKFPAPSYLYYILEQDYRFLTINKPLCVVEYLPDGNSMNKMKQYSEIPNAFAEYRIIQMKYAYNWNVRFRSAVHYVSSKLLGNSQRLFGDSPSKLTTLVAFPFGAALAMY